MIKVRAHHAFEIEVALSASYYPGCSEKAATTWRGALPAEEPAVEDVALIGLSALKRVRHLDGWVFEPVDLLEGVDTSSPVFQRFAENIVAYAGREGEQTLLVSERPG